MENVALKETHTEITKDRDIYGSFSISGIEFALSVKSIQEVVNEPDSYTSVPLSPDYLMGLFNLRGAIIPVVDLRKIFNFQKDDSGSYAERKIAIIEHGHFCVGLLFDKTGEIFNSKDEEKSDFNNAESDPQSIIKGVFKMDSGKRIIQILDPVKVLKLDHIPRAKDNKDTGNSGVRYKKNGSREQCISFEIGDTSCAISINAIQEIINTTEIGNSTLAGEVCLGVIDIRGNTVPIIDFNTVLGYPKKEEKRDNYKVIIMKLEDELFGLPVDSVKSIISYFSEDLVQFPFLGEKKKNIFKGCIPSEKGIDTILLNHQEILSNSEINSVTKGHSNLYKEKTSHRKSQKEEDTNRKTYITFSIGEKYALRINEVNEVIDFPEEIIHPPNLSKNFKGMINLRGVLVAIIDPRSVYNMDRAESREESRILIFKSKESTYGLVVDSVDAIRTFADNKKFKVPEILSKKGSLFGEAKEAVDIESEGGDATTILILNIESIVEKLR